MLLNPSVAPFDNVTFAPGGNVTEVAATTVISGVSKAIWAMMDPPQAKSDARPVDISVSTQSTLNRFIELQTTLSQRRQGKFVTGESDRTIKEELDELDELEQQLIPFFKQQPVPLVYKYTVGLPGATLRYVSIWNKGFYQRDALEFTLPIVKPVASTFAWEGSMWDLD